MNLRIGLSVLVAMGTFAVGRADQLKKADWLIGTWTICEDPDHSTKDSLQFNADGTGLVIRTKGNVEFTHKHTTDHVSIIAYAYGHEIPIEYTVSPEHDRLFLYSKRTGHTSYYVRIDGKLMNRCSSN